MFEAASAKSLKFNQVEASYFKGNMDAAARQAIQRSKNAQEADLHPDDILKSMAACLVEDNSAIFNVATLPDRQPPDIIGIKKPPKEIFYRKTQLFATRIPGSVGPKRCTCKYLCHGAPADIKCLSCVMYDPKGLGFFCKMCFDARHPWYRVPHIFNDIEKDESVEHTLKVSHRRAEMVRYEKEGQDQLKELLDNVPKLDYVADDHKMSFGLKEVGSRTMALEKKMRDFRKSLREDIRRSPLKDDANRYAATGGKYHLELNDDEAASVIAKAYRGYKVRHVLSTFIMHRIVRGHDHASNREFFFDKVTKKSSWKKPALLMHTHMKVMSVKSTIEKELKKRAAEEAAAREYELQLQLAREYDESSLEDCSLSSEFSDSVDSRGRPIKRDPYAVKAGIKSPKGKKKSRSPSGKSKSPSGKGKKKGDPDIVIGPPPSGRGASKSKSPSGRAQTKK